MPVEIKGYINPTNTSVPTTHLAEIHDGGLEPTDSFTVTKNLSHCAISNEVVGEASYYAEIAPTGGWSDLQVTIKVGGVDMSEYYSSGVITIPNVTGNIVITAIAASAPLSSITAVYTQSGTVYDTDTLDSLKSDLVVTATYEDETSATVTDYTLSGTLTEGTSTITVSYGGKTTTFDVIVASYWDYAWDASSGNAPTDINGGSMSGAFVNGLFKMALGGGEFAYAQNRPIECEIEVAVITLNNASLIPMFAFCYSFSNSKGSGFKFYNSATGKIATNISGSTVTTNKNFPISSTVKLLKATASANGCTLEFDGETYSGTGIADNQWLLTTSIGLGNNSQDVADVRFKSIKYRYLEA